MSAATGILERIGLRKARHIDVDLLWMQEQVGKDIIKLLKVKGDDNIADQCYHNLVPRSTDEIASVLTSVNPLLTDASLYERLHSKNRTSQFKMSIGSTTASEIKHVIHDGIMDDDTDLDNSSADEDILLDKIFKKSNDGNFDVGVTK